MENALILTVLFTVGGAMAVVQAYKNKRLRQRVADEHDSLVRWAEEHGWRAYEGIDLRYAEVADRITGLTGEPGDWQLSASAGGGSEEVFRPSKKWEYGTILARETASGELVVLGCWREGESVHHLFGSLQTDGVFSPYTIDVLRPDVFHVQGKPPPMEEAYDIGLAMLHVAHPARLRFLDGRILMRVPGDLSPDTITDFADRLARLHNHLPRRPDRGPMS